MPILIALVVVVVVMLLLLWLEMSGRLRSMQTKPPKKAGDFTVFKRRASMFSAAEWRLYELLKELNYKGFRIAPKVRLADIFELKTGVYGVKGQEARERIASNHVDFLLISDQGEPSVGINLDGERPSQSGKEEFLSGLFRECKISFVRIPWSNDYEARDVHLFVRGFLPKDAQEHLQSYTRSPFPRASNGVPRPATMPPVVPPRLMTTPPMGTPRPVTTPPLGGTPVVTTPPIVEPRPVVVMRPPTMPPIGGTRPGMPPQK
jgi:hypothetical protein